MSREIKLSITDVLSVIERSTFLLQYKNQKVWGIPRGGIPIAFLCASVWNMELVDDPKDADVIVDDIIASGATAKRFDDLYGKKVWAPYHADNSEVWYTFPWESSIKHERQENATRLLQSTGREVTPDNLEILIQYAEIL